MRFDLLLFDLDGTLVDSLPDITQALNHVLARAGLVTLAAAEVRELVGDGVLRLAENALARQPAARSGTDGVALARAVADYYGAHPCVLTRAYPGIVESLHRLRADGHRLGVVTNKPGSIARAVLAALKMTELFEPESIIGDGDGYPRKPDPQGARALIARHGSMAERTLVVGDGLPDLALARALGCSVAAVVWGYTDRARLTAAGPDFVVQGASDLLSIA